jgi:integrase
MGMVLRFPYSFTVVNNGDLSCTVVNNGDLSCSVVNAGELRLIIYNPKIDETLYAGGGNVADITVYEDNCGYDLEFTVLDVSSNPFNSIERMKKANANLTYFSASDLAKINKHLPLENYPLYAIAYLIFHAYIRIAELPRICIADIDLNRRVIIIRPEVGKNRKQYIIGMHPELHKVLVKLNLHEYNPAWYLFSSNLQPGTTCINPNRLHDAWRIFATKHKINKTLYKLKHTGAGMSVEAGANIRDLQLQLRHSSLEMTQIYLDKFKQVVSHKSLKKFASFGNNNRIP